MGNVKSVPTRASGEMVWKCVVCGATVAYSQPISFQLSLDILKPFMNFHDVQCVALPVGKEAQSA